MPFYACICFGSICSATLALSELDRLSTIFK